LNATPSCALLQILPGSRTCWSSLGRPLFWNGLRLEVGASIGAALVGRPRRRRITELFAEAGIALYDAKAGGRNKVHLFGDEGYSRAA
jgi:GGDEF domain-containing protein